MREKKMLEESCLEQGEKGVSTQSPVMEALSRLSKSQKDISELVNRLEGKLESVLSEALEDGQDEAKAENKGLAGRIGQQTQEFDWIAEKLESILKRIEL